MSNKKDALNFNSEKELMDRFKSLCTSRSSWQVWADFITAVACTIANSIEDKSSALYQQREDEYEECIERLGGVQIPSEMFAIITMELDKNPEQDFLGKLFMTLGLGNHWKGQFFTPYSVCQLMSEIDFYNMEEAASKLPYISVNDCACGAGATLIAMANTLKKHDVNYQQKAVFVAQDVDRIAGLMCYIQLSLLGCPGYVVIANTLTNPLTGSVLNPNQKEGQEFWVMPMFNSDVWRWRRAFDYITELTKPVVQPQGSIN